MLLLEEEWMDLRASASGRGHGGAHRPGRPAATGPSEEVPGQRGPGHPPAVVGRDRATPAHRRLGPRPSRRGRGQREVCPQPVELHRRFEVLPGVQAQADRGDDGSQAGRNWVVRLQRGHDIVTIGQDLGRFSAQALAGDLRRLFGPAGQGGGTIE